MSQVKHCSQPGCTTELPPERIQHRCTKCKSAYDRKRKQQPKVIPERKECSRCQQTKPISGFYKDSYSSDGHSSWCKSCQKDHDYLYGYGKGNSWRVRHGEFAFLKLVKKCGTQCPDCGKQMTGIHKRSDGSGYDPDYVTVDHIIPRALGGIDVSPNLRLCCRECNMIKYNNIRLDLLVEHGLWSMFASLLSYSPEVTTEINFIDRPGSALPITRLAA